MLNAANYIAFMSLCPLDGVCGQARGINTV